SRNTVAWRRLSVRCTSNGPRSISGFVPVAGSGRPIRNCVRIGSSGTISPLAATRIARPAGAAGLGAGGGGVGTASAAGLGADGGGGGDGAGRGGAAAVLGADAGGGGTTVCTDAARLDSRQDSRCPRRAANLRSKAVATSGLARTTSGTAVRSMRNTRVRVLATALAVCGCLSSRHASPQQSPGPSDANASPAPAGNRSI